MTMTMMMMEIGTDGNGGHGGGGGGGTTGVAAVHNGHDDNNAGDNGVFVYIVQRRGYAGWQQSQSPPVDYRRLLMTRSEADQVAYGSAHHFAQGGPVRTIQLPDGTFGFVSANHLYWVRKVSATATNGSSNNTTTATTATIRSLVRPIASCRMVCSAALVPVATCSWRNDIPSTSVRIRPTRPCNT
jgi:hypothetical protein